MPLISNYSVPVTTINKTKSQQKNRKKLQFCHSLRNNKVTSKRTKKCRMYIVHSHQLYCIILFHGTHTLFKKFCSGFFVILLAFSFGVFTSARCCIKSKAIFTKSAVTKNCAALLRQKSVLFLKWNALGS